MTLATDILNRAGVNLAPPPPKRKVTRRGKITTAALVLKPVEPKHCYKYGRKWQARLKHKKKVYTLGMHDTAERAKVAARLFKLWVSRYPAHLVPTKHHSPLYPDAL